MSPCGPSGSVSIEGTFDGEITRPGWNRSVRLGPWSAGMDAGAAAGIDREWEPHDDIGAFEDLTGGTCTELPMPIPVPGTTVPAILAAQ